MAEQRTAPMGMGMGKGVMALAAFPATAAAAAFVVAAFAASADAEWGIQRAETDEGGEQRHSAEGSEPGVIDDAVGD